MMPDTYLTITSAVAEGYYTDRRSKFYAFAHHVETAEAALALVKACRTKYYDARHVCYAYMLGAGLDTFRSNDDGEPSGTAGKPILGQIRSAGLTDIVVIVVRYYGGINLGTPGLIQAYRTAAAEAIATAVKETKTVEAVVRFHFAYPMMNSVMRVVRDMGARVVGQDYAAGCSITLAIAQSQADTLQARLDALAFES